MESRFFVLRTALLPFDALLGWSEGLEAPAADPARLAEALAADRDLLRRRLAEWIGQPEVDEALFVASPSIHAALERWRRDPDSRKGRRCETALVRYFVRMSARATPFGLFAGSSLGTVAEKTRLELAPRGEYRRHTRLDMDYVFALAEDLARDPALRGELTYRPNSSLYFVSGCWRLAEVGFGDRARSHHLVEFDASDYLDAVIDRARSGARMAELAEALRELLGPDEVSLEEALEFVGELVDSQVLVADLSPPLTGPEPVESLISDLAPRPEVAARLRETEAGLRRLDEGGLGASAKTYRGLARDLEELGTPAELQRLFQVDLAKPVVAATLGREVLSEVHRSVELLHRLWVSEESGVLRRFREAFVERYGDERRVPLMEVLDDEVGIGFGQARSMDEAGSPLLAGLDFPGGAPASWSWRPREAQLLRRLEAVWKSGARVLELSDRDVEELAPEEPPPPLPDALHVLGTVAASSCEALERGDFQFVVAHASGPSGVRLLGRFCHSDDRLRRRVEEHLRQEEALAGDAVLAEIVHVPQGRMGNVLRRPRLRDYEIPYLGRSVAPAQYQVPVSDLLLTVADDKIELYSARLGRRVLPRLTSAHNYESQSLALYRFLGYLQNQGLAAGLFWSWGAFEGASFLPRVRHGRVVLTRARWRLDAEEVERLVKLEGVERYREVRRWATSRSLPRRVVLVEDDNELVVDLDNVLAIDTFLDGVRGRNEVVLVEMLPGPEELCVRGPEGAFVHEVLVPCVRGEPSASQGGEVRLPPAELRRSFPPGSEWLYAKLYTGPASADRVLCEALAPLVRELVASGAADSWFFIRYGDPDWHLRLRFHGEPGRLMGEALPKLLETAAPLLAEGRVSRLALDTYERELERYGGEGIVLAERLFAADSEAALSVLETCDEASSSMRWRAMLLGIDRLLADSGLVLAEKWRLMGLIRDGTARVLGEGKTLRLQIDRRYRDERRAVEALLTGASTDDELEPARRAFAERSRLAVPLFEELGRLESAGRLTSSVFVLVPSFLHMLVNRWARSSAREHELVLYDFLHRHYRSLEARARGRAE